MIRVGIVGASGYAGGELIRLLLGHGEVRITNLVSRTYADKPIQDIYPGYTGYDLPNFKNASKDQLSTECDVVFLASPSGTAWPWIKELLDMNPTIKIVDIGSDLRLKNPALYEEWYGYTHGAPELLSNSIYGLTELYTDEIKNTQLVANPGCYPTATILAFAPLIKYGLIDTSNIIVNALSGVSGAGRTLGRGYHFPECNENMRVYSLLCHRHIPEIEQEFTQIAKQGGYNKAVSINFTPHLVPLNRGILVTGYADFKFDQKRDNPFGVDLGTSSGLIELYKNFYKEKEFIRILPLNRIPETKAVTGSNYCDIGVRIDKRTGKVLVMSVIDNLMKGASGQAVQNMNLMFGKPENIGLNSAPIWP